MAGEDKKEKLLHIKGPSRNKRILERKKQNKKNVLHSKRKDSRKSEFKPRLVRLWGKTLLTNQSLKPQWLPLSPFFLSYASFDYRR